MRISGNIQIAAFGVDLSANRQVSDDISLNPIIFGHRVIANFHFTCIHVRFVIFFRYLFLHQDPGKTSRISGQHGNQYFNVYYLCIYQ